ncbi:MAG TPA: hypothetical protein VMT59_13080 [Gaiellaceae bacterium]|nr:hypothetical protein [Gaiellaceae bacterium]
MTDGFRYELVLRPRPGLEHTVPYVADHSLQEGDLIVLRGRRWIVDQNDGRRVSADPARYRLVVRHPDGVEEAGAFRRYRAGGNSIGLGHAFTTLEDGGPVSWSVDAVRFARDENGAPYVELVAERDYAEAEELPDHELEHDGEAGDDSRAAAVLRRAEAAGLQSELVSLDAGTAPDWDEAAAYLDALVLEELGDDLLELCGVDFRLSRDTWLDHAKERLREDLRAFRADIEGDHDEIEEWEVDGARVFASVGSWEDEADPDKGHGWMSRLVDASILGAAGFRRVRKVEL